ncbi:hypothetical protein OH76DRAFT_1401181 [Lentinus brumalis]|uniref:Uncharacterized protein n=1 Tax=Lentinus brumalis TaxID=2498619 RepID=A0A371DGU2_9APHY|nr:hypothetical protein OH76DRAFT_1401181 [Polyporus brumalis]
MRLYMASGRLPHYGTEPRRNCQTPPNRPSAAARMSTLRSNHVGRAHAVNPSCVSSLNVCSDACTWRHNKMTEQVPPPLASRRAAVLFETSNLEAGELQGRYWCRKVQDHSSKQPLLLQRRTLTAWLVSARVGGPHRKQLHRGTNSQFASPHE